MAGLRHRVALARGLVATMAAVLLLAALAVALHLPVARAAALRRATDWLDGTGLTLSADDLDYNLFTLSATLSRPRLSAKDAPTPFFEAERVHVNVRAAALLGQLVFDDVELTRPVVRLQRMDGSWNFPRGTGGSTGEPPRLDIRRLRVDGLRFDLHSPPLFVGAAEVQIDMAPTSDAHLRGALRIADGLSLQVGERRTSAAAVDGTIDFDGRTLVLDPLTVRFEEGQVWLKGRIGPLLQNPAFELAAEGFVDLAKASKWVRADASMAGRAWLSGTVEGPAAAPTATLTISAPVLTYERLDALGLRGQLTLSPEGVQLSNITASIEGGQVSTRGRIEFGARPTAKPSVLEAAWTGVDLQALVARVTGRATPRLGARATGTGTLSWKAFTPRELDLKLSARLAAQVRTNALPVGGTVSIDARAGRQWTIEPALSSGDLTLTGQIIARADAATFGEMAVAGPLRLRAPALHTLLSRVDASGVELPAVIRNRVDGAIEGEGRVFGTASRPALELTVVGQSVGITDVAHSGSLEGQIWLDRDAVRATAIVFRSGQNTLTGDVQVDLAGSRLSGALSYEARDLASASPALDATWHIGGGGRANAVLSGTPSQPLVSASLALPRFEAFGQTMVDVEAGALISTTALDLDRLVARDASSGSLQGSGRVAFGDNAFSATLAARDWTLADLRSGDTTIPLRGLATLSVNLSGTMTQPRGTASLSARSLAVHDVSLGEGRFDVSADGSQLDIAGAFPLLAATLRATVSPMAPYPFALDWRADGVTLDGAFEALRAHVPRPEQLDGQLTGRGRVSGDLGAWDESHWTATVTSFRGSARGLPFTLEGPANAEGDASTVLIAPLRLELGQTQIALGGRLGSRAAADGISATIDGRLDDVVSLLRTSPSLAPLTISGPFAASVRVSGPLNQLDLAGMLTLSGGRASWRDLPAASDLTIEAEMRDGTVSLTRLNGAWQDARLNATGSLPLSLLEDWLPRRLRASLGTPGDGLTLRGRVDGVGPAALEPFLSTDQLAQLKGRISGTFSIAGQSIALDALTGELTLDEASVSLVNVPLEQLEPTRLRLASSRVTVDHWQWRGADNQLEVSGGFTLTGERPLAMTVRTLFDLRAARAFMPALDAGGFLTGTVDIGGTATTPRVTGSAYVTEAMVLVRNPRLSVYDISATLNFEGTRLEIADAYGWANGGLVTIAGSASYPSLAEAQASVRVTGNEIGLEFPAGVRSLVAPDLRVVWKGNEPTIEGRVSISGGTYRSAVNLTAAVLSRTSEATRGARANGLLARTRLDISVVTSDDMIVDNNYGRLEIGADLRVGGTVGAPALLGRLAFREGGEIYLGGNTYHLEEGAIDFVNPARIEPDLSVTARTQVGSHGVTLTVTGTPGAIRTDLSSDEGYTQDQLLALLVTGQPDSTNLTADIRGDEVLGLLSGELSGFLSRTFGVRGLRVERGLGSTGSVFDLIANDVDPTTRLTLSQEFSQYVEVILSQNLRKTGALTWLFILKPRSHLDVRFTSRDDSSRAVEIRQEFDFGGRTRAGRPASQRARTQLRVDSIGISGSPGFSEAEIRRLLSQKAGSAFDFFSWQDDRDRLQRFYTSRGYLEARVIATRRPLENDPTKIVVEYQLTRGPLCELSITGIDFDGKARDALLGRWSGTGLDAFLLEDLSIAARDILSEQGYLRARISAEVERPSPDRKVLSLRVDAGAPSTRTRVRFVGQETAEAWEIERWMYEQGLHLTPWTDQATFSAALEGWYRGRGHLTPRVRVDPPTFENASATATVRIDEGPRFVVGTVDVTGTERRPLVDVLADFGVKPGAPYDPVDIERGSTAVVRGYRAQGFNDVRDTTTLAVRTDEALVDVTLALEEGRQQVLADVVIEGNGTTNAGLIAGALRLEPGAAVDLNAWQQSRRRLYELGTFRSVRVEPAPIDQPSTSPEAPQRVRARVSVEEWPLYRVLYGVQLSSELSLSTDGRDARPALLTELQRRNLFGRALTAGVAGRWQSGRRIGRGFVTSPRLFGLGVQSSLILTRSREDLFGNDGVSDYFTDRVGLTFEQRFQPARSIDAAFSYRFERNETVGRTTSFPAFDAIDVGRLNAALAFDSRDRFADARSGVFHSSTLEYASTRIGSDIAFVKYLLQQYVYPHLGPVTLAGAFRLGLSRALGRNEDLIGSERFRTGGGSSVRGYAQDSLGPRDFFGDPAGGRGLLVLNGEARFPIYRWLRGVTFVDAGNVFMSVEDISLTGLAIGTGVGIRLETPAALLRVDYGVPTSSRFGERRGRWYFSIGQIF